MTARPDIHGFFDPGFAPVRDAFARNFEKGMEIGASLAMTWRGRTVVDIWAGHADLERTTPWLKNTVVPVASSTKVSAAIMLLMAIDRGLIELDEKVAHYWPAYAQGGKGDVTVRNVLTHQGGAPGLDPVASMETLSDWDAMCARIAAEPHWFEDRSQICYHGNTFGFICGELVRRVDGRRARQFLKEEIADRVGLDFQIGLTDSSDLSRVAAVTQDAFQTAFEDEGVSGRIYRSIPRLDPADWAFYAAELPGVNGVANGRAIARLCAIIAMGGELDSVRFLSPALAAEAGLAQASGLCPMLGPITFGLGFGLHNPAFPAPTPTSMHWGGFGGSWAFADPRAQVSLGYAPNNWRLDTDELHDRRLARFWRVLAELLPTL